MTHILFGLLPVTRPVIATRLSMVRRLPRECPGSTWKPTHPGAMPLFFQGAVEETQKSPPRRSRSLAVLIWKYTCSAWDRCALKKK